MSSNNCIILVIQISIFLLGCNEGEGIIGGDKAPNRRFLYHVSILRNGRLICGGGLIDKYHVITAAHCVADNDGEFIDKPLNVVGGTNNLNYYPVTREESLVKKVYIPHGYTNTYKYYKTNDIAVLKVHEPFDFGSNNFLILPRKYEMHDNKNTIVTGSGWNRIELYNNLMLRGDSDGALRFSVVKVLSLKECLVRKNIRVFPQSRLCGLMNQLDPENPEGLCFGDSGSPLVFNNNIIVGVANNAPKKCSEEYTPATYARVSFFVNFIKKCVADNTDSSIKSFELSLFS